MIALLSQAKTYVATDEVFKGDIEEIHERLGEIIKVFRHFRKVYERTRKQISEHNRTPRNGDVSSKWDFPSSMIFARADGFLGRIEDIKVFISFYVNACN